MHEQPPSIICAICGKAHSTAKHKNYALESVQEAEPNQILKKGEWVDVIAKPADKLVEELEKSLCQKAVHDGYIGLNLRGTSSSSTLHKTVVNAFKDGIKHSEWDHFKMRLVDVPERFLKEEGVVMASAYEFAIHLTPRYQKDGNPGEYVFKFITRIKTYSPEDKKHFANKFVEAGVTSDEIASNKLVFVTTLADPSSKNKIRAQTEGVRQISQDIWASVIREGFLKTVSAGSPGLGKGGR